MEKTAEEPIKKPKRKNLLGFINSLDIPLDISYIVLALSLYFTDFNVSHLPKRPRDHYKNETNIEAIVKKVTTWEEARDYLDGHLRYTKIKRDDVLKTRPNFSPFEATHNSGGGICADFAVAAHALLMDDPRYECRMLTPRGYIEPKEDSKLTKIIKMGETENHSVCLVHDKLTGKYGILGQFGESVRPEHNSEEEAFDALNKRWGDFFLGYGLCVLDTSTILYGKHIIDKSIIKPGSIKFYSSSKEDTPMNLPISKTKQSMIVDGLYSRSYETRLKSIKALKSMGVSKIDVDYTHNEGKHMIYAPGFVMFCDGFIDHSMSNGSRTALDKFKQPFEVPYKILGHKVIIKN